ncbi:MAG: Flp family type IVb pilin, partial [Acidobacteria bacterium]|nr:Flp family type IVb pilin [Acidobacteriota bacterium]
MLRLWWGYQSRFIQDEEGASMVEYALLVALIAVVVIAAALFLGDQIS